MKNDIQDSLKELIKKALQDLGFDKVVPLDRELEFFLSSGFGDISNNIALKLASQSIQPAKLVSQNITEAINRFLISHPLKDYVKEVKSEGAGFINFYLNEKYFYEVLKDILSKKEDFARINLGKSKPLLIEFVSANPTGPLSVAHARQAAVGDALANILFFLGFKVQKEYYLNDEGNQINILGRSIEMRLKEILTAEKIEFPENFYQGEYIIDLARQIQDKKLKIKDFSEYGTKEILKIIKKELEDFGVQFDCWYSQKELNKSGKIKKVLDSFKEKGFLYEQEGAWWFKSTDFGDDKDRVVVKSDGSYTYLAPDIAYHRDKYKRGFKRLINLWGPDHHGYINRLKAAVKALGATPESLSIIIVQLASIFREDKPIEMSTRRGQYITLREVLDEVGVDASRFFFLMRRTSSHLVFDLETAKKQTPENPVYYIQYAHARISSILRQSVPRANLENVDFSFLKEKEEMDLIKKLWQFSYILNVCYSTLDPYMLTVYLQEVAEVFHRFYDRHRVLGNDDKLTQARLYLILATKIILATGLKLLGVSTPEKM
jgi:arginyl-tRNA synthetase